MTDFRSSEQLSMARHPDILALRERYERVAATPAAQAVEALAFLAGMYAAISPWVVGFRTDSSALTTTNLIVGLAVAVLAFSFAAAYERTHGLAAVVAALGAWLIIAPWVVDGVDRTTRMLVSNIAVGACILLLGAAATMLGVQRSRHYGR